MVGRCALACVLLVGCALEGTPIEEATVVDLASPHHAANPYIFGGSAPDAPHHEAAVSIHFRDGDLLYLGPFCTGTLVAPNMVMTAAHCLDTADAFAEDAVAMDKANVVVYVGDDPVAELPAHAYTVSRLAIHAEYDRWTIRNDIAMLRLRRDVSEANPVAPLPEAFAITEADEGRTVNFAGFGMREDGGSGTKTQVDGQIAGLGCAVPGCWGGGDEATQVSYSIAEGGPCFGDSGGPMFLEREGDTFLAGVISYGDEFCSVYGASTRVASFANWWGRMLR
jgi:secreted trypsin-like serine protease